MQSTTSQKPIELTMWWPSPEAFEDLGVEDSETGFTFSAPDHTECADWLGYWAQSDKHIEFFTQEFIQVLTNYANNILEQHGQNEVLPDGSQSDREQAEDVGTRALPQH